MAFLYAACMRIRPPILPRGRTYPECGQRLLVRRADGSWRAEGTWAGKTAHVTPERAEWQDVCTKTDSSLPGAKAHA